MAVNTQPMGIKSFGAFSLGAAQQIQQAISQSGLGTTGTIYYLDPVNGFDGNDGLTVATAVKTLGQGYALLASGNNDVLVLIGNGASTGSARLSAAFDWKKSACHLVGVCAPSVISQRARIAPTLAVTAFKNFFTVSGSGCLFANLSFFHGFTAGTTAQICVTVTGSRNAFVNVDFEGMGDTDGASAIDADSRSLKISGGGQENLFSHCNIGLDTVKRTNANASVEIAGGGPRNIFEDCTFPIWSSDGLQYFLLAAAVASLDRWVLFRGCQFISCIGSGGTAIAQMFHTVAGMGGLILCDNRTNWYGCTAVGDAATKALTYLAAPASTSTGGKATVAT